VEAVTFICPQSCSRFKTSPEYVSYIIRGLRERGVPEEYIEQIRIKAMTNKQAKEDEFRGL
jgi:hypothetical protein